MKKTSWFFLFLIGQATAAWALEAKVELYEANSKYAVLKPSENVVYLENCTKTKLDPYQWKIWNGNYSVRAYVLAVAIIEVSRSVKDPFLNDYTAFIQRALEESAGIGGNLLCLIKIKKEPNELGFHSLTFRAYKQMFQSGVDSWVGFYEEKSRSPLPLTLSIIEPEKKSQ